MLFSHTFLRLTVLGVGIGAQLSVVHVLSHSELSLSLVRSYIHTRCLRLRERESNYLESCIESIYKIERARVTHDFESAMCPHTAAS